MSIKSNLKKLKKEIKYFLSNLRIVSIFNRIGLPFIFIYILSMLVIPLVNYFDDWPHILRIWDRWQGFNVGMLAFISSIIVLNVTRFTAENQRKRDFLAAKAFLPHTLDDLTDTLRSIAFILIDVWNNPSLRPSIPTIPDNSSVFKECILHADSEVSDYLTNILVKLQILYARLDSIGEDGNDETRTNLLTYLVNVGELQVLTNKLFPFARSMEEFDRSSPSWDNFHSVYAIWFIDYSHLTMGDNLDLRSFTERYLDRT